MSSNGAETVDYTISNLGLEWRQTLLMGVHSTGEYLHKIGATGGVALAPVRSRLLWEIMQQGERGSFTNIVVCDDGTEQPVVGSLSQSFAPTISEMTHRFHDRAEIMPRGERIRRLASNVGQYCLMPPVMDSLETMKRIANIVRATPDDMRLFGNLYPEELPENTIYDQDNAPYTRSAQLTPDLIEKLGIADIHELPNRLRALGITALSINPYHIGRRSQSGRTELPPWREYLPEFAKIVREVSIPINRNDLPDASGTEAKANTFSLAEELTRENARTSRLGQLPEQLACILEERVPNQPLTICVSGKVPYPPEKIRNIYDNLKQLVEESQP